MNAWLPGPRVELHQRDVALEMPGRLRIGAERIELHSREGGVDIRSDGDTIVRSRIIRLNESGHAALGPKVPPDA